MKLHCAALLLASLTLPVYAEDAPAGAGAVPPPAPAQPSAGLEFVKIGTVAKPLTAGGDAVAILSSGGKDTPLLASGDVATKLKEFADKGAKVTVTGTLNGEKMSVVKVEEEKATASNDDKAGKKKKDKGEKGEKKKKKKDN